MHHELPEPDHQSFLAPASYARFCEVQSLYVLNRFPANGTFDVTIEGPSGGDVAIRPTRLDLATIREVIVDAVYASVLRHVETASVIVDLGANIGITSWYLAKHYPSVSIVAVEPDPCTHDALRANLTRSGVPFELLGAGVWSNSAGICRSSIDFRHGVHWYLEPRAATASDPSDEILPTVTMPEISAHLGGRQIDLLKVDIEGAEVEMFRDNVAWLADVGCIAIEFHDDSRQRTAFDEMMQQYQFEIVEEGEHTVVARRSVH